MTPRLIAITSNRLMGPVLLTHPKANPLTFRVTPEPVSAPLTGASFLRAEIRRGQVDGTTTPLSLVSIPSPTGNGPFDLAFSGPQLNLDLDSEREVIFWLVIYVLWPNGDRDTLYRAHLKITEDGALLNQASPPVVDDLLTRSEAQSLFASFADLAAVEARIEAAKLTLEETAANLDAEAGDRAAADAALAADIAETTSALEAVAASSATKTLSNVTLGSVVESLLATGSVSFRALSAAVQEALGGGPDPALYQGPWTPATNTPTIPAAAGHSGWSYQVAADGTATGNAAGTYVTGDRIVSNGTVWAKLARLPTIIPDGSLSLAALAVIEMREDITLDDEDGTVITFGIATEDGTELIIGLTSEDRVVPDSNAGLAEQVEALEPLLEYLEDEGIPRGKIAGTEVRAEGGWILDGGEHLHLAWLLTTEDGTELVQGGTAEGVIYPPQEGGGGTDPGTGYTPPAYILAPGAASGLVLSDATGPDRVLIDDGSGWSDVRHLNADTWLGRSDRIAGAFGLHKINVLIPKVLHLRPGVLYHFGVNGQSLALGTISSPILTAASLNSGFNLMFNAGTQAGAAGVALDGSTLTHFVNMVELAVSNSKESPWSGCFNRINLNNNTQLGTRAKFLVSNHAFGGTRFTGIYKGTQPYANLLTEVTRGKAIAASLGMEYVFVGELFVHGEADSNLNTPAATYDGYLKQYRADMTADILPITGQTWIPRIFICQSNAWTHYNKTAPTASLGQLSAGLTDPYIHMVGPKYHLIYSADGVHLPGLSSRLWGEYFGKVIENVLFGRNDWKPLHPVEVGQDADTIWARFHVPAGHLVLDTTTVSDPGNFGFEFPGAAIIGAPAVDGDRVIITKTGTATHLRYAYTGISGADAGPTTGPRGNLRDSDPAVSLFDASPLHNWCAAFSEPLP